MNSLLWVACGFFALALGLGIMSAIVFRMHQQLVNRPEHRSKRVR